MKTESKLRSRIILLIFIILSGIILSLLAIYLGDFVLLSRVSIIVPFGILIAIQTYDKTVTDEEGNVIPPKDRSLGILYFSILI